MKIAAALELEKQRQEDFNKVYVHRDGKFYHAYEWSAWLIKTVVCTEELQKNRGDAKMLKASRYSSKHCEYVMLGFPVESLSKYMPTYTDCKAKGDDLEITVAVSGDYETMAEEFDRWRNECQAAEKVKSDKEIVGGRSASAELARMGLFGIVAQVLSYPVENRTPSENIDFISRLKQQISALL